MVLSNAIEAVKERYYKIVLSAYAPVIRCSVCGEEYVSTGKHDPGICRECRKKEHMYGGPLSNEKVG